MTHHLDTPVEEILNATAGTKPDAHAQDAQRQKLPEEIKFDKAVYGGISYAAQAGTGIVLTNWIKNGGGQHYFQKLAEALTGARGASATEKASSFIIVSTMIMVGNAFLLPVKWLENRKPQIIRGMVERANKRREAHGDMPSEEELAHQLQHLDKLDKEPKQTWWSLGGGRAFSLAGVYLVERGIGGPRNEAMSIGTTKAIQEGIKAAGMKTLAQSKTLENYLRIGFYDMFYSTVSAGGLYIYSHFVKPPKKEQNLGQSEADALGEVASAAIAVHKDHRRQEERADAPLSSPATWSERHKRAEKKEPEKKSVKHADLAAASTFTERADTSGSAQPTLAV